MITQRVVTIKEDKKSETLFILNFNSSDIQPPLPAGTNYASKSGNGEMNVRMPDGTMRAGVTKSISIADSARALKFRSARGHVSFDGIGYNTIPADNVVQPFTSPFPDILISTNLEDVIWASATEVSSYEQNAGSNLWLYQGPRIDFAREIHAYDANEISCSIVSASGVFPIPQSPGGIFSNGALWTNINVELVLSTGDAYPYTNVVAREIGANLA